MRKKGYTKECNNEHYYEKVNFEKNEVKSLGKIIWDFILEATYFSIVYPLITFQRK